MSAKISALPAGAALAGGELFVSVQTGADVQTTAAQVAAFTLTIGNPIAGGFNNGVPYQDGGGLLACNSGMRYYPVFGFAIFGTTAGIFANLANQNYAGQFNYGGNPAVDLCGATRAIRATDGGRTVDICDGVNNVTYTPANPGDWVVPPTDVWKAIDRIARVVSVGGTVPIP